MRKELFEAIAGAFPGATITYFGDMTFTVSQTFDGRVLSLPITVSPMELAHSRAPELLIAEYVRTARKAWELEADEH
jgi:hypothetical protein